MIHTLLEPPAAAATVHPQPRCNLLLHCGSQAVNRSRIAEVPTPPSTRTWQPVAHLTVLNTVERALLGRGLAIVNSAYALDKEANRFFALLEIRTARDAGDYSWIVGVRNSHDKSFPAGIVAGTQVLVCSNLAFSGEIKLARKHTRFILRDLDELADNAVQRLVGRFGEQARRIEAYKQARLRDTRAHDLIIRAVDAGVCSNQHIPKVLDHWRNPEHPCFRERTLWSLQNAFTEALKGNLNLLPTRTEKLHYLLDHHAGIN
ncbi:DUF932 domain-containing protein [Ruficoccus amylovorans]|uniref:DUF932 domain-containing protein n=1 Tax=Ruficoccus amylovorans TaxID=1804625 RepID=A0A842HDQ9_9BACT|nr:DUF932 domain-containing protein [Ruficoccus amylovorans]MBC2594653.1 DUF932 domain-containing protein [Ruficoccus amylovorans]